MKSELRYFLRGYQPEGCVRLSIPSSRKQLAIARSMVDLGVPNGEVGRWEITPETWSTLAPTFDWPDWDENLRYFLESVPIGQDSTGSDRNDY
ncbi:MULTISPECIES: hypothetical protein [unclassified Streptomyces]|uniref:hypothetical protein n=1 Tax=unclassified Streptomyces TaxID=2593676 RepID=UPI002E16362A|nr:hypothetical protein OG573_42830 [Streptomyces sp. NBC_01205]